MSGVIAVEVAVGGGVLVRFVDNAPAVLPAGWVRESNPRAARLPANVAAPAGDAAAHPATASALVTLGTLVDGDSDVFVALSTLRHVAVLGAPDDVSALMLTWAHELAVADGPAVRLIGFDPAAVSQLPPFARVAPSAELPDAPAGSAALRQVVLSGPLTPVDEVERVHASARQQAVAAATATVSGSGWSLVVAGEDVSLRSLREGVVIDARRDLGGPRILDAPPPPAPARSSPLEPSRESSSVVLDRIAVPASIADQPAGEVSEPVAVVRLLGSVRVDMAAGARLPSGTMTEAVAYLACHRHGVTADRLLDVVWDGRYMERRRLSELLSRARRALGGIEQLPHADSGRYRLGATVVTDVEVMAWRVAQARRNPAAIERSLSSAVALIGGRPFANVDWAWATHEGFVTDASAFACDVAAALGSWQLERRNPSAALQAAQAGMRAIPESEQLARVRMRAYHQRGEIDHVRAVIADLTSPDGHEELHPSTVALYAGLISPDQETRSRIT